MKRQSSAVELIFYSTIFLFFFSVALLVNFSVNKALHGVQRQLLAQAEQALQLRLSYRKLYFKSLTTISIEGVVARSAHFKEDEKLFSCGRIDLSFDLLGIIFSGGDPVKHIDSLVMHRPEFNIYGSPKSEQAEGGTVSVLIKKTVGKSDPMTRAKLAALVPSLDVAIVGGKVRYYSGREQAGQAPNFVLRVKKARIGIENGLVDFKIRTLFSMMPASRMFVAQADMQGQYNLLKDDAYLLFTMANNRLAGIYMPDMRFFIGYNKGVLEVDSRFHKQVIQVNGKYSLGKGGRFELSLSRDSRFFMDFINKNLTADLDGMFFHSGGGYRPGGKVNIRLGKGWMALQGNFSITDKFRRPVLSLRCRGDAQQLHIGQFYMRRGNRLISLQGRWLYQNMLPELKGVVNNVRISGETFSGNFALNHYGNDRYRVALQGVSVNGALLGSFATFMQFDSRGVSFDSRMMNNSLNLRGYIDQRGDIGFRFITRGFNVGGFGKAFGLGGMLAGRRLSGKVDVSIVDNIVGSEGQVKLLSVRDQADYYALNYSYDGEAITIKRMDAPALGIGLRGSVRLGVDSVLAKVTLRYAGRTYPVESLYRAGGAVGFLTLNVGTALMLNAKLGDKKHVFQMRLRALPLDAIGVKANVSGVVNATSGQKGLYSFGRITCSGDIFPKQFVKNVSLVFNSVGKRINLQKLVLQRGAYSLKGAGYLQMGDVGLRGGIRFSDKFIISLSLQRGLLDSKVVFRDFILDGLGSGIVKGKLNGYLLAKGKIANPVIEGSLKLTQGALYATPFSFAINTQPYPNGFSINSGFIKLGTLSLALNRSTFSYGAGGGRFVLSAGLGYAASMAKVSGSLVLDGAIGNRGVDFLLGLHKLKINGRVFTSIISRMQLRDGVVQLLRRGPTGVTGFYNLKKNIFSLKMFDNNLMAFEATGQLKADSMDFYMASSAVRLEHLNFFPKIFQKASGRGSFELSIQGNPANPRVQGGFELQNGRFETPFLSEPVKNFAISAKFDGKKINITHVRGKVGKGSFELRGNCYFRKGKVEDLNLRFRTDRKNGIPINIDDTELKSQGLLLADLFIKGNPNGPDVSGRIALKDNNFSYMDYGGKSSSDTLIKRINWHMDVNVLDGVKYSNPLVTAVVKPGSGIRLRHRIRDRNFLILGRVEVVRGNIDYINHDFVIEQPTYLEFKRVGSGFDAWLTFIGRLPLRIDNEDEITVYLSYSGYIKNGIKPKFHSDPYKKESEILALLGVESKGDANVSAKGSDKSWTRYTDMLSTLGLKMFVSKNIKQLLGLDLFSIRMPLVRNLADEDSTKHTLRDTQFSMGKYLTSFIFIEYTLTLKDNANVPGELIPAHEFGLELSFKSLKIGYLLKPTIKSEYEDYEQSVRIRFRHRF